MRASVAGAFDDQRHVSVPHEPVNLHHMGEQVQALARRVRDVRDPLDALEAVRELRRELDGLEEEYVRAALVGGASWDTIGSALGVSRQAAHRRLARRVSENGAPSPSRARYAAPV
jgi:hypothetical protein